jgi:hypothetical protein
MLKAEEDIESRGRDIDIGGPQSPTPYLKDDNDSSTIHHTDNNPAVVTSENGQSIKTATNDNKAKKPTKRIQFNMSSRIQFIPSNRQGQYNTAFLGTLPGVLKIAEIIIAFITFVLSICSDRRVTTAAWTEHISFETTIVVSALLLGYVALPHLTQRDEATREGLILIELLFYGINTLFYFIAIWLMVQLSASWNADGRGAAILAAILCVAMTVLFAIETIFKFKALRGENASTTIILPTNASGRRFETNAELARDNEIA